MHAPRQSALPTPKARAPGSSTNPHTRECPSCPIPPLNLSHRLVFLFVVALGWKWLPNASWVVGAVPFLP